TGDFPSLTAAAERFLDAVDYVGFANFDVKVDPRTGAECFFEINPRIGRNNYYVTAAGESVARHVVADRVLDQDITPVVVTGEILYSILPVSLVLRYLRDPALRTRIRRLARTGLRNPFRYRPEGLWMRAYSVASGLNFVRKYRAVYSRPTDTGFSPRDGPSRCPSPPPAPSPTPPPPRWTWCSSAGTSGSTPPPAPSTRGTGSPRRS